MQFSFYRRIERDGLTMKQEYYFGISKAVAEGSKCLRRQYGAVIVKHDTVISTGT